MKIYIGNEIYTVRASNFILKLVYLLYTSVNQIF